MHRPLTPAAIAVIGATFCTASAGAQLEGTEWHLAPLDGNFDGDLDDPEDSRGSIRMDEIWALLPAALADGIGIGVIDSYLFFLHEDFDQDLITTVNDNIDNHGTKVTGILAAQHSENGEFVRGIAPRARIYFRTRGFPSFLSDSALANAVQATMSPPTVRVHTNSWYPVEPDENGDLAPRSLGDLPQTVNQFVAWHGGQPGRPGGVPFVVAAGNDGLSVARGTILLGTLDEAICVSGIEDGTGLQYVRSSDGLWIDVAAPAVRVPTLSFAGGASTSSFMTGTSAAAPIVAGVIAQMMSFAPSLEAEQARRVLHRTARKDDFSQLPTGFSQYGSQTGYSDAFGYGHVDAFAAIVASSNVSSGWGGYSFPAPVTGLDAAPSGHGVTLSWANPISPTMSGGAVTAFNGEYEGVVVVRYDGADLSWRPPDGTAPIALVTPPGVRVLAYGDFTTFDDTTLGASEHARYSVFVHNAVNNYSVPVATVGQTRAAASLDLSPNTTGFNFGQWTSSGWSRANPNVLVAFAQDDPAPPAVLNRSYELNGSGSVLGTSPDWNGSNDNAMAQGGGLVHTLESPSITLPSDADVASVQFREILEVRGVRDASQGFGANYCKLEVLDAQGVVINTLLDWHFNDTFDWRPQEFDLTPHIGAGPITLQWSVIAQYEPVAPIGQEIPYRGAGWWLDAIRISAAGCHDADLNLDGIVDDADSAILVGAVGACPTGPAPCPADINGDGTVDGADRSSVLAAFGTSCTGCAQDIDGNGIVDGRDLSLIDANWGQCPTDPALCAADLDGDGDVDGSDLAALLAAYGQTCEPTF